MEVEVPLEEIEFELILQGQGRLTFNGNLLKYVASFDESYQAFKYTRLEEHPDFTLEETLWQFLFDLFKEHDKVYDAPEEALATPLHLSKTRNIKSIQLVDLFRMVRVLNFYDATLAIDLIIRTILERLFAMRRQELALSNPKARFKKPSDLSLSPLEMINKNYNVRLAEMNEIFARYIETQDIINLITSSYLAKTTSIVAAGDNYALLVTQRGLFADGVNQKGALGFPKAQTFVQGWTAIPTPRNVISVWSSENHTLMLSTQGLYAAGNNQYGQLGIGETRDEPRRVDLDGVLSAACGLNHSVIQTRYGVYATGRNHFGQLGLGTLIPATTPKLIEMTRGLEVVQIVCGDNFSMLLTKQGEVYGWGRNIHGVLNRDPITVKSLLSPERIVMPAADIRIVSIAAGDKHAFFLDIHGRVFGIGSNQTLQLGISDGENRSVPRELFPSLKPIVSIFAGNLASFFVDEEGDLYASGYNMDGQLGLLETAASLLPVKVPNIENVISVACGNQFSIVVTCNGVFILGNREDAQPYTPPRKLTIEVADEPICLSSTVDKFEDDDDKKRKRSLQCLYCGSLGVDAIDTITRKPYCSNECLKRYHSFRV